MINSCPVGCSYPRMEAIYYTMNAYTDMVNKTGIRFIKFSKNETGGTLYFASNDYKAISLTYSFKNEGDPAEDVISFKCTPSIDEASVMSVYEFIDNFWVNRLFEDIVYGVIGRLEAGEEEN